MRKQVKGIGLLSGGLDSILATKIMLDMGVDVIVYHMSIPFHPARGDEERGPAAIAERFGIEIVVEQGGQDFMEMIKNPKFGTGKGMNPCIECRIFLLNKATRLMEERGADFIFTGEVVGSRPMSQLKHRMNKIEKEAGLKGKLLRPLSAKYFDPTDVEIAGLIDREKLHAIEGRSRQKQMELAVTHDIGEYPNPGGGCLLTEPRFSNKVRDLLLYGEEDIDRMELLRIGRHFRLPGGGKAIVGRNSEENELLSTKWARDTDILLDVEGVGSPITLLYDAGEDDIEIAASITARYSDANGTADEVQVNIYGNEGIRGELYVLPLSSEKTDELNLGLKKYSSETR